MKLIFPHLNISSVAILCMVAIVSLYSGSIYSSEKDLYDFLWLDQDKKVYVLQQKVYQKKKSYYINIGLGFNQSNDFFDSTLFNLSSGYYFTEEWAIEINYNSYSNSTNETYKTLGDVNGSIPFSRQLLKAYGVMGIWSPFYGKVNTFNKIFYFDWNIGAGLSQITAVSNKETAASSFSQDIYSKEKYTGVTVKTGLKFHTTEHIHVGIDLQVLYYEAPGVVQTGVITAEKWRSNSDIIFSVGYSF
ncbi:MAG: outer membrane beta-barrel domain-containing protein [Bacteriovoracaceae bacterium]|nr:outer membrane beta-barrel domain-containing protein [Bacteriovoracaceae bacterium]